MKISRLKNDQVVEFSELIKKTIKKLDFYNERAVNDFLESFSAEALRGELNNKRSFLLSANHDGKIVGFFCADINPTTGIAFIDWVGIDEDFQKQGIATKMLEYFVDYSRKNKKIHKIVCNIAPANKKSIYLFKKNDFKKHVCFKNHWYGLDFFQYCKELR